MEQTSELVESCYGTKPSETQIQYVDRPYKVVEEKVVRKFPWDDLWSVLIPVAVIGATTGGFAWLFQRTTEYDCNDMSREYVNLVGVEDGELSATLRNGECRFTFTPEEGARLPRHQLTQEYVEAALALAYASGGPPPLPEPPKPPPGESPEEKLEECQRALKVWKQ